MTAALLNEKCQALEKGSPPLDAAAAKSLHKHIPDWQISDDGKQIVREFKHKDYYHTLAFVNAVAWIAHSEDHHPDLFVTYNRCKITFSTHSVGGLSRNDFICAAKIDALNQ